jgi:hypothetical protein
MAKLPLLASLPFDLRVVASADAGKPLLEAPDDSPYIRGLGRLVDRVEESLREYPAAPAG